MTALRPQGVIVPIVTPLDDDERLDTGTLDRLIDHLLPDVDGVFVLGSSGELALLDAATRDAVIARAVERVARRRPVYVGVGDTGTRRAIANARRASRAGVDAIVVCGPFYYPVTDQGALRSHFEAVADAADRPVLLYNIPQNTVSALTPDSVLALAAHPNIVGIKDSWGDMFLFQRFLEARSDAFSVLQGREQLAALSFWAGADGVVSALANFAPARLQALRQAVDAGDRERAVVLQREVTALAEVFDQAAWLPALKVVLAELGFGSGRAAGPLPIASPDARDAIQAILVGAGLRSPEVVHG
jgi:4-hydroxy-tetrahydrodipicolinate synthase